MTHRAFVSLVFEERKVTEGVEGAVIFPSGRYGRERPGTVQTL